MREPSRVVQRGADCRHESQPAGRYPGSMRIALVSPYSWTYQGGVNRHVEALAEQFIARGDHVRVLAPWDPPDAAQPSPAPLPPRAAGGARLPGPARAGPSASVPTARSPISRSSPRARSLCAASCAPATTTSSTCTSRWRRSSAGTPWSSAARRWSAPSTPTRPRPSRITSRPCSARAAASTSSPRGSPSPRPPPGPGGAGSAASTRSSPTASTSRPRRRARRPASEELRLALRRPRRGAQGAARAARGLRGAGRARPLPPDHRRRGSRGDLPPRRRTRRDVPHRRARQGLRLDPLAPARRGRPALRALARRRELRHGPDRGDGRRARR